MTQDDPNSPSQPRCLKKKRTQTSQLLTAKREKGLLIAKKPRVCLRITTRNSVQSSYLTNVGKVNQQSLWFKRSTKARGPQRNRMLRGLVVWQACAQTPSRLPSVTLLPALRGTRADSPPQNHRRADRSASCHPTRPVPNCPPWARQTSAGFHRHPQHARRSLSHHRLGSS